MLKFFKLSALFYISSCLNANAAAYDVVMDMCRDQMQKNPPQISVAVNYGNLEYTFDKSTETLNELFLKKNPDKKLYGDVKALTDMDPNATIDIIVDRQIMLDDYVCVIPKTIKVNIFYKDTTIHLLNTLNKRSCLYKITRRHEQAHVEMVSAATTLLATAVKKNLTDFVFERGPQVTSIYDSGNYADKLKNQYQSYLMPIFEIFAKTIEEQNNRLDSKENYEAESALCN